MGGEIKKVNELNGHDPASLEAWQRHNTREIRLTDQLSVRVRNRDLVGYITDKENPLLPFLQDMQGKDAQNIITHPKIGDAMQALDTLLAEVIVSPPIKESGHKDGISIKEIPSAFKMQIFGELMGGEATYAKVEAFPQVQGKGVEPGKTG